MNGSARIASILLASVALSSLHGRALAEDQFYHGSLCTPADATSAGLLAFTQFGAHNVSTTSSAKVVCGARLSTGEEQRVTTIMAEVYDRHPSQNVCCNFTLVDRVTGETLASGSQCTSGQSQNKTRISFEPLFGNAVVGVAMMECTLPPHVPNGIASGFSHVTMFRTRTSD
jgi:hypothetical protein